MNDDYWQKQATDKPLFEDLLWSRPENKKRAGKLLIIGGNGHGFAAPAEAYSYADKAGAGTIRVLLPDVIKPIAGKVLEHGDYTPSTPSGSFSKQALSEFIAHAAWADGVLVAGDLGRNSETAVLLESFATNFGGPLIVTKDGIDYLTSNPLIKFDRSGVILVLSLSQLQRLVVSLKLPFAVTFNLDVIQLVELLHQLTTGKNFTVVVSHLEQIFVAHEGTVVTTKLPEVNEFWRVKYASFVSVWLIQNPSQILESVSTAIFSASQYTS